MKLPTRRFWVRAGLLFVMAFVAIQFVPYGRDHANPPADAEPAWDSPDTRTLAKEACFDCHSNETEWPAYSNVAPISWLIQRMYQLMHAHARLSAADRRRLALGLERTLGRARTAAARVAH